MTSRPLWTPPSVVSLSWGEVRREGVGLPVVVSAHVRNGYTIIAVLKLTVGAMLLPRRVFFGEFPVVLRWCQTGKWASSIDGSVHAPHHTPSSTRLKQRAGTQ